MEWRPASGNDAAAVAEMVFESADAADQAHGFMSSWQTEVAIDHADVMAAVAVLAPTTGHHRGYGAWWDRRTDTADNFNECIAHLIALSSAVPNLETLQVTKPADDLPLADRLQAAGFGVAYPVWTMAHDSSTWPSTRPGLPDPLRLAGWNDIELADFHDAYLYAYQDQRLVEPHTIDAWLSMTTEDETFAADFARLAVTPDGKIVSYVLGFRSQDGGLDLGPVGTVPEWRHRGLSTALLSAVLLESRYAGIRPVTLTTDGDSPTAAQRLYTRLGFTPTEKLAAFQRSVVAQNS